MHNQSGCKSYMRLITKVEMIFFGLYPLEIIRNYSFRTKIWHISIDTEHTFPRKKNLISNYINLEK